MTMSVRLGIVVHGETMAVTGVCGDSSVLVAQGAGGTAAWGGSTTCAPIPYADCPSVTHTLTSGSLQLRQGEVVAQASGRAEGCGVSVPLTVVFTGRK